MKHKKTLKIGFIMDPMEKILLKWDTSISFMMEAETRGHKVFYIEPRNLFVWDGAVYGNVRQINVSRKSGFKILEQKLIDLKTLDVVFNRKEPVFDVSYLYLTQILELLEPNVFVINSPSGLRKANEKLYILQFKKWTPPTFVSNQPEQLETFRQSLKSDLILKPLDQKGGHGIKLLPFKSKKAEMILKQITMNGFKWIVAQKFLRKNLTAGDKRILILNGKAIGQFGRIPKHGEFRANLSLGGKHVRAVLTKREKQMVRALGPQLIRDGLYFVGIDVVDGKLIEINVTSPAGTTEINLLEQKRPEVQVVDFLEETALRRKRVRL